MTRILVIEDDRQIGDLVRETLAAEGYSVDLARDGPSGLTAFETASPDLVVLDRMLPGLDGLEVLSRIRRTHHTPVLFLTVRDDETDKVVGLEMGADDYMTKPFSSRELVARIRSLLRRASLPPISSRIEAGPLVIDLDRRTVTVAGKPVETTRTEFDLLALMARNPRIVLSREKLLDEVWGYKFEGYQRTVDSHVTRLRKKVEADPHNPRHIRTVWGVGYRFCPDGGADE